MSIEDLMVTGTVKRSISVVSSHPVYGIMLQKPKKLI